jgi:hypothetical protein|tara:strand:- start:359 stop:661 length:303 start_codon:yes stop_codon:yes gene_type:complete
MERKIKRKNKQKKVVPIKRMTSDEIVKKNLLRMLQEQHKATDTDSEPQLIFDSIYWLAYMHLKRASDTPQKYHLILGLLNDAIGSAVREIFLEENGEEDE